MQAAAGVYIGQTLHSTDLWSENCLRMTYITSGP